LAFRSLAQWLLADQALENARNSGNYATAAAQAKSFSRSPKKKLRRSGLSARHLFRVAFWLQQANPSDAVQLITSGLATSQVTGTTFWLPLYESCASYGALAHTPPEQTRATRRRQWPKKLES
jgi:hypothetical protein